MRRTLAFALAMIFLALGAQAKPIRVMIDPGHGGEDEGACQNNIKEKNITLRVALEVKKLLDKDPAFHAILTRNRDVTIPLANRPELAVRGKADVFISIHANSSNFTKARGTEIYFENQMATDEETLMLANRENNVTARSTASDARNGDLDNILSDLAHNEHMVMSQQLSQHLLEAFQREMNIKTRAIRQAPFRVLGVNIPATLIEVGFITNPIEGPWLTQSKTQKQIAKAIYEGLKSFKEKLDKVHISSVN